MMLLIAPMVTGSIAVNNQESNNMLDADTPDPPLWNFDIWAEPYPGGSSRGFNFGEAEYAYDGPPADIYDVPANLGDSLIDIYSTDGFGPLWADYRQGPDTEKTWDIYIGDSGNPRDCNIHITWPDFNIHATEYQIATFYIPRYDIYADMTYYGGTYWNHYSGDVDHFEISLSKNTAPNKPSIPSGPSSTEVGEIAEYSTQAVDPDGDLVQYMFAWGDGEFSSLTELVLSGQSASMSYAWQEPGTYLVQAQARDEHGVYGDWSEGFEVVVTDQGSGSPPDIPEILDYPSVMVYGETYEFTAVTTDPDGDDVQYEFSWDYEGDWSFIASDFMESGVPCTVEQSFESPGYTMQMSHDVGAIDINGLHGGYTEQVHMVISDPPTEVYITGETSGIAGKDYTYQLIGYDPNYNDLVSFEINWGDGNTLHTLEYPIMTQINVPHVWNKKGDYVISVTVFDSSNLEGPTETLAISMPKNRAINNPFYSFLQQYPILYQLLQRFLKL